MSSLELFIFLVLPAFTTGVLVGAVLENIGSDRKRKGDKKCLQD